MKKFFLFLAVGFLVILVTAYIGLAFFLGSIVKSTVNRFGPKIVGAPVELAAVTISPRTGEGTLGGFVVGNPAGWSSPKAFSLGTVHIQLEPKSLLGDVIVINELVIDRPEFNYETRVVSSNIGDLLANIEKYIGGGEKDATKTSGPGKKFIVKKLRFTNGNATIGVGAAALPVPLPEIRLDDIGVAEGGITGGRLAAVVMGDVLKSIVNAATGKNQSLESTVMDLFKKKPKP